METTSSFIFSSSFLFHWTYFFLDLIFLTISVYMFSLKWFELLSLITIWFLEYLSSFAVKSYFFFSQFEFLNFVRNWVIKCCSNLSVFLIWAFEFCSILGFDFSDHLRFWVLSELRYLSFVPYFFHHYLGFIIVQLVFFSHNLSFWVLSQFDCFSFVTVWVFGLFFIISLGTNLYLFQFCHNICFSVLSQF